MIKVRCFCVDDANKPNEIPSNLWVKKDEKYHITHIFYHYTQGIQGVELAELYLDDSCKPYETFRLTRFRIPIEDLMLFLQLLKDCTELTDIDAQKIVGGMLEKEELVLEGDDDMEKGEEWKKLIGK